MSTLRVEETLYDGSVVYVVHSPDDGLVVVDYTGANLGRLDAKDQKWAQWFAESPHDFRPVRNRQYMPIPVQQTIRSMADEWRAKAQEEAVDAEIAQLLPTKKAIRTELARLERQAEDIALAQARLYKHLIAPRPTSFDKAKYVVASVRHSLNELGAHASGTEATVLADVSARLDRIGGEVSEKTVDCVVRWLSACREKLSGADVAPECQKTIERLEALLVAV